MMQRTIHPVGCAQFITESFYHDEIHVVIDCGMGRGKKLSKKLEGLVDDYFACTNHIDILFISHFDNDHYNGVKYLINKKLIDSDTRVYIPLLNYPMIYIMDMLENYSYRDIIHSIASAVPRITFVRAIGDNDSSPLEDLDMRQDNEGVIDSFSPVSIPFGAESIWEYRPFYIQDSDLLDQFKVECAKEPNSIDEERLRRYQDLNEAEKEKLKGIYNKLKGNHYKDGPTTINMNAMLLISREVPMYRSTYGHFLTRPYTFCPFRLLRDNMQSRSSCLYTSDAGLSSPKSMDYVVDAVTRFVPEGIGLFQIPHHGSYKCYTSDIYRKLDFDAAFINGDLASCNPAICADAINDAYKYSTPLYLADEHHCVVQVIRWW